MADKKTYKTASGAQQYGSTEDFKKQKDASFKRFLENPTTKNALMENMMGAGYYGARSKEFNSDTYGELEQLLSGFAKDNKNKLKKEEKPKAGPKGNVKKMAEGGKTGMRGQVKKDEKTGQKKRIKKGTEEYGRSRMEGLKSVSPDDIKTVYPAGKPKQDVFGASADFASGWSGP